MKKQAFEQMARHVSRIMGYGSPFRDSLAWPGCALGSGFSWNKRRWANCLL